MTRVANQKLVLVLSLLLVAQMAVGPSVALTAPAAVGPVVHVVQAGENLFRISLRYGTTIQAIMQANNLPSTTIYVGQRLIIPGSYVPPSGPSFTYIVQPGDTLYAIARRYGTTMLAIAQMNGLVNPSYIYVGQRLLIPGTQSTPPPSCGGVWYTVQAGDTVSALALRYCTTIWIIISANNLPNANRIYVGQRLFIVPGCGAAPTAPCPTATPTSTSTSQPQDTPTPTDTPPCCVTPTPTPTATLPCCPTATPTPTATPPCGATATPTPTPEGYAPAPWLSEPESGANFFDQVRLKWIWPRRLESDEGFVVRWLVEDGQHLYEVWTSEAEIMGSGGNIFPVEGGYRFELNFDLTPYPGGESYWSVALFGKCDRGMWQISPWSESRQIFHGLPE